MNFPEVVTGNQVHPSPPPPSRSVRCILQGQDYDRKPAWVGLDDKIFEKHLLFLGSIGTGKTNALYQVVSQLKQSLTSQDVMIIFDAKGDFLFDRPGHFHTDFYTPGDIVISNDQFARGRQGRDYWNIFEEIEDNERLEENVLEIASSLFSSHIKNSNSPFFPMAAKDIFAGVLIHFIRTRSEKNNQELRQFFDGATIESLVKVLKAHPDLAAIASYLDGKDSRQAPGIISVLQQVVRSIFIGNFKKPGSLSMRKLVRKKSAKTIFVEYDIGFGQMLTPIYQLLIDLAIKEALSRGKSEGNVWIIADEFRLLPNLTYIENAVNFGRSLGVKLIVGVQNFDQIIDANGSRHRANSILSGFSTAIVFRLNDASSREFVSSRFGKNRKIEVFRPTKKTLPPQERIIDGLVVEDWDISNLGLGETIIGLPEEEPFFFKFDSFDRF